MRIAFLGTPVFAVQALREIAADGHDIAAVYTRAPAPRGRGHVLQPSPVQALAEERGLPVRTPKNFRDPAEVEAFRALNLDAAVVVAYGLILPKAVLDAPRLGAFNLHGSLLPRWRGAAPIQRAIMAGDPVTGVQVMRMSEGLDEGRRQPAAGLGRRAISTAGRCARTPWRPWPGARWPKRRRPRRGSPTPARSPPTRPASIGKNRLRRSTATSAGCRPRRAPGSRCSARADR